MTISFTLKPWHFAVLVFLAGAGLAAVAVATISGDRRKGAPKPIVANGNATVVTWASGPLSQAARIQGGWSGHGGVA